MTNQALLHWNLNTRSSPFQLCFTFKEVCSYVPSLWGSRISHCPQLSYRLVKWHEVVKEEVRIATEVTTSITNQLPSAWPTSWGDIWDNISPVEANEPGKWEVLCTPSIKSTFVWSIASLRTTFLFSFLMTQISLVSWSDMVLFFLCCHACF